MIKKIFTLGIISILSVQLMAQSSSQRSSSNSKSSSSSSSKSSSSSSSSSSDLTEQVRRAKEQEAAYKKMQSSNPNEKPFAKAGASLPAFHLVTSDEQSFFDKDLDSKKPLLLVIFNPSCGHCVDFGKIIKDSISKLPEMEILFVTALNQLGELKKYLDETGLEGMPNVRVTADNSDVSKYLFEYNGIPQIMIYNKQKVLQKTFYKGAKMDSLNYYFRK
jgi:thiol-disulfide isomerase/thioredoxin